MLKTTCWRRRTPEGRMLEKTTMSTSLSPETRHFLERHLKYGPNRACVDVCQSRVRRRCALKTRRRSVSMDSIAEDHYLSYSERRGDNATTISSPCMLRAPISGFCLRGRMPHHSRLAAVSSPTCQLLQQYYHSVIYLSSRRVLADHTVSSVMCFELKGTCTCRMWQGLCKRMRRRQPVSHLRPHKVNVDSSEPVHTAYSTHCQLMPVSQRNDPYK